jgi:sugar lactone lactonase YvrE
MESKRWLGNLGFPEGPRWHLGRLWFSDFGDCLVRAVEPNGAVTEVARVSARPSGLGWMPDGALLVVSMTDRRLLRVHEGRTSEHADLSPFADFSCNDMVVDGRGNAYVGHFGFDLLARTVQPKAASLLLVRADGSASVAAPDLAFPNGAVLSGDGRSLIVAETFAGRLTAFDVGADGGLSSRRVFAALPGRAPDGICIDRDGAIWVADAAGGGCVRVEEGGEITDTVSTQQRCYACALGGADGHTLFLCTADGYDLASMAKHNASIETVQVAVPGVA